MHIQPDTHLPQTKFYNEYLALVTQNGTSAPTAITIKNQIGTATWARVSTGVYTITIGTTAQMENKTTSIEVPAVYHGFATAVILDWNVWEIQTYESLTSGTLRDDCFRTTPISIKIYNQLP